MVSLLPLELVWYFDISSCNLAEDCLECQVTEQCIQAGYVGNLGRVWLRRSYWSDPLCFAWLDTTFVTLLIDVLPFYWGRHIIMGVIFNSYLMGKWRVKNNHRQKIYQN